MKIYDLDSLIKDEKQDNLYNFFEPTYKLVNGIELKEHVVTPEQVMRMDLVCQEIYNNTEYVDFLCDLNRLDNPLNLKSGDIIYYPNIGVINQYRIANSNIKETQNTLLNANKSTKKDKTRQKYVEQNFSLPPTVKQIPDAPVKIENNQIVIG